MRRLCYLVVTQAIAVWRIVIARTGRIVLESFSLHVLKVGANVFLGRSRSIFQREAVSQLFRTHCIEQAKPKNYVMGSLYAWFLFFIHAVTIPHRLLKGCVVTLDT
jgi:hypothetical protein